MKNAGSTVMASASMIALASAHGFILSPSPRMPGDAMAEACGQQVYYNQEGDNYGNVQGQLMVAENQQDYDAEACNIWLCKGYKFEDNKDNVQEYSVGDEVKMEIDIRAPHTGSANVSVVSTSTGQVIGSTLKSWDEYASNSATIPADQTEFSITIPDVGSDCSSPGDCVIQWFWDAPDIEQTYESCVDIVVGGSGSGSSGSGSAGSTGSSGGAASNGTAPAATGSTPSSSVEVAQKAATTASSAAAASSNAGEADETCEVVYVTASAAAETPAARRHKRHTKH